MDAARFSCASSPPHSLDGGPGGSESLAAGPSTSAESAQYQGAPRIVDSIEDIVDMCDLLKKPKYKFQKTALISRLWTAVAYVYIILRIRATQYLLVAACPNFAVQGTHSCDVQDRRRLSL